MDMVNKTYLEQYLPIISLLDQVRQPGERSIDLVQRLVLKELAEKGQKPSLIIIEGR